MPQPNILSRETFYYYWDGKEHCYRVEGDEEGMWSIYCDHKFFRVVNGNDRIYRATSVTEALKNMGKTHKGV